MEALHIKRTFPLGDNDGRHGVADEVGQRAGFGHEAVHAEDEGDTGHRDGGDGRQRSGEGDESGTRDPGRALGGQQQYGEQGKFFLEAQFDAEGLRDEDSRHRQINGSAVKVERVAGRDHDAHDVLARAHVFELCHEGREGGFGRGRAEHEPQFMGDVAQQLDQREPGEAGDDVQDDKDEQQAGQVEAAHEIAEGAERAEAVLAHGEGHSAERAERGELHDDVDDAEQGRGSLTDEPDDTGDALAEGGKGRAAEQGNEQHLEDVAIGERAYDGAGDDVHQEVDEAVVLGRSGVLGDGGGVEGRGIDVHSPTRLEGVDHHKPDDKGQGRHRFKIDERFAADTAELLHIFHACDAEDHGAENDRRDDHLDKFDEPVTERLHGLSGLGIEMPKGNTKENGTNNLKIKRLIQRLLGSFHDFLLRAPGRTGRPPPFSGSTFGGRVFPGVRSRGGQRILSVSRRGRDKGQGWECPLHDCRMASCAERPSADHRGRRQREYDKAPPRGTEREGDHRRKPCGQERREHGGSGALSGVVHRGVVVLLGKFVPTDVRDAHLRLDQQGLIDVLNDRFVLRRSVAECAFLRLMGISARAPAACRQQRGKQDEQVQRQEKASFHGLSARLNMNRFSLILYRRSRFGSRENGKKME